VVIGTSGDTKTVTISNNGAVNTYPPITLRGMSPTQTGILTADKTPWTTPTGGDPTGTEHYHVLNVINGARVTLGNDLTITGGGKNGAVAINGAGVRVSNTSSSFTMNGGTITDNHSPAMGNGGGVFADGAVFTMTGGTITGNAAVQSGGGVYIAAVLSTNSRSLSDLWIFAPNLTQKSSIYRLLTEFVK
jgi:hypothetical protein